MPDFIWTTIVWLYLEFSAKHLYLKYWYLIYKKEDNSIVFNIKSIK